VKTEFTPSDIEWLASQPGGAIYLPLLLAMVIASVVGIVLYERKYPALPATTDTVQTSDDAHSEPSALPPAQSRPPPMLDRFMSLVYPLSLGLDEGICHLTMKSAISMIANCSDPDQCGYAIMYGFTIVWVVASLATVWWLRVVFARYETTHALPIEYGTVNVCSVCSGLIFYRESQYMENWQVTVNVVGLFVILIGIGLGQIKSFGTPVSEVDMVKHSEVDHEGVSSELKIGNECSDAQHEAKVEAEPLSPVSQPERSQYF